MVGPDGVKKIFGFRPPLERGSIFPAKELTFCKGDFFCILCTHVMTLSALSHGTFKFFIVHVGVVSPEEFEGVGAGHLLVVL